MSGTKDAFLGRWQKRKAAVAAEEAALNEAAQDAESPVEEGPPRSDVEILADLGLDHPDTLYSSEDVRTFLAAAVPDHLRRIALRKLWRLNPVLANLDGLVEYGEDYTDAATVVDNLQTVYQVGKGMVQKVQEALEDFDEFASLDADEPAGEMPEEDDVAPPAALETQAAIVDENPAPVAAPDPDPVEDVVPTRRRMRFHLPTAKV